jgi:uncharacterized protein (TIGR02646 family)
MRFLERGDAPECLSRFDYRKDKWSVVHQHNLYGVIWEHLNIMQHRFCAYCECRLPEGNKGKHIEHFYRINRGFIHKTFDWMNLFGSCDHSTRCGRYKDNARGVSGIDLDSVCKPDIIDPDKLLLFLNNGRVLPRSDLNIENQKIASNTIDIFNLDGDSNLVNSRKAAIKREKIKSDAYWELNAEDHSPEYAELLEEEMQNAMNRVSNEEFSTALKHLWKFNREY